MWQQLLKWTSVLVLIPTLIVPAELDISWQAPTQNVDSSPLTNLTSFELYTSETAGGPYTLQKIIPDPTATSDTVTVPDGEQRYIVMTAVNSDGNRSSYSNEVLLAAAAVPIPGNASVTLTWSFDENSVVSYLSAVSAGITDPPTANIDFTVTIPTGADLMVAQVSYWRSGDGAAATWTFDQGGANTPMNVLEEQDDTELSGDGGVWHMSSAWVVNPASGSRTIRIAVPGSGATYGAAFVAGFWDGIDTANPILASAAGYDTSASLVTITSTTISSDNTAGHMAIFCGSQGGASTEPTFNQTGQTQRITQQSANGSGAGFDTWAGFGTLNAPASGTDNMQCQLADGAWVVVSFNPSGGGGGGTADLRTWKFLTIGQAQNRAANW